MKDNAMPSLLWKLIMSPNEKVSSEIIQDAIRTRLFWQKPKEQSKGWFWGRENDKPEKEPGSFWADTPKEEKKGLFE